MGKQLDVFKKTYKRRDKLTYRLSYYPNKLNPTGFYTYIPHPCGKKSAIRRLFMFDPSLRCDNESAYFTSVFYTQRVGELIWGEAWLSTGTVNNPRHIEPESYSKTGVNGVYEYNGPDTERPHFIINWVDNNITKTHTYFYDDDETKATAFGEAVNERINKIRQFFVEQGRRSYIIECHEAALRTDSVEKLIADTIRLLQAKE
ncbi:hypothetical protein FWP33_18810 [Vibrio parahaemolyticus]|nr:hypothetical protein [Vibrio parahaemolyticus]EJC7176223.1 hypothetical protein [Vibrio parahaemolyticus]EJG0009957.1 hypothetical protein [Vibrio parahaemolyticus]